MFRYRQPLVLAAYITLAVGPLASLRAEPIGWVERFALADDREAMLDELIPGTDDASFYRCLYYQTIGDLERAETVLADWLKEKKGQPTPLIQSMSDRQRLLTYPDSPDRTVEHFVRQLGIQLRHAPPVTVGERRYPSELDQAPLAADRQVFETLRRGGQLRPAGHRYLAERFAADDTTGIPIDLRQWLERLDGPYVDGLADLVIRELQSRPAGERRFGDLAAHAQLTLDELRRVAEAVPTVSAHQPMVTEILRRLRPGGDHNPAEQPDVRLDYLRRVEQYTRDLPAGHNGLKAAAAFRLLEANLSAANFDRELFLRYLRLPRVSPIIRPAYLERERRFAADLTQDHMEAALLPPIGDERRVVRAHLEHFLTDAENSDEFEPYLLPEYLRRVFAETKLLAGVGPADRWYRLLTPAERQAIRDRVELRLADENPDRYLGDRPAELLVDVKNIDELIVRIYEINAEAYYRDHDRPIDTDIDLDGLVATSERKLETNRPAIIRHRQRLTFPEMSGRGVWVVDLVGKGVRARALIRRGELHAVASDTPSGPAWSIVDENRAPVPSATMLVDGREFVADDQGKIVIPPAAEAGERRAIVRDGEVAESIRLRQPGESYRLEAAMTLDTTLVQGGREAQLLLRPRLLAGGLPIDPGGLRDPSLIIAATDADGVRSTRKYEGFALDQGSERSFAFRAPHRLRQLEATLSGTVDRVSDGQRQTLTVSESWEFGEIRQTTRTRDAFLTRDGERYVIEVRGRNGEPVPTATVTVSLETDLGEQAIEQTLQSDASGHVRLGPLPTVREIRFGVAGAPQHRRTLRPDRQTWPVEWRAIAGQTIRLPLAATPAVPADRFRLLEIREDRYHSDHTARMSLGDGLLSVAGLEPGDYRLVDRLTGESTGIAIVDGPVVGGVAVGQIRHRQLPYQRPLGVASITPGEDAWRIQLSGDTAAARVHVIAKRFFGPSDPIDDFALSPLSLSGRPVHLPKCGYVSGLRLGEEYQYVLRRRYAAKYPGVMLPTPGMLLNPWETEVTDNVQQTATEGDAMRPSAAARQSDAEAMRRRARERDAATAGSDYDFLADPGVILHGLLPDDQGVVSIPADLLKGMPIVYLVVCDPVTVIQKTVADALAEAETIDQRVATVLPQDQPFSLERTVMAAGPERPLDLAAIGTGQLQVLATVDDLYRFYRTLAEDPRFDDFEPLTRWHRLDRDERLEAYTRLASHETHLFLWAHDRAFFDEVIRPYLSNKQEKQFVDRWLLEQDLTAYTDLWRYRRLNAAEKALLARRLPDFRPRVTREFRERLAARDEDHERVRLLIESALAGERLDESQNLLGLAVTDRELGEIAEPQAQQSSVWADFSGREGLGAGGMGGMGGGIGMGAYGSPAPQSARAADAKAAMNRFRGQAGDRPTPGRDAAMFFEREPAAGRQPFFRNPDDTKQWAESQWDRLRTVGQEQPQRLIPVEQFWADLAVGDGPSPTLSADLLRPVTNRHAALVALAFCGLPLESDGVELPSGDDLRFTPPHAVAVVTRRLRELSGDQDPAGILIGQRFSASGGKPPGNRAGAATAAEPDEFLTGVAYRGEVVISNPNPTPQRIDVLWQIPAGSIPLSGGRVTDSRTLELQPLAVAAVEYHFYFPSAGEYQHYPATVSDADRWLGRGGERTFLVVDRPSRPDPLSWESLAREGTPDQIRQFLGDANLRELDWLLIAHRMRDAEVYSAITETLADANLDVAELWAYGFHHRDEAAMRTYLSLRDDLVGRVGPVLRSPLLDVDPLDRAMIEPLEYAPLIRARIHRLGDADEIFNPKFLQHYREFVRVLSFQPRIEPEQQLSLAAYLLSQNRIEEAIGRFGRVDRDAVGTQLQHDYLAAYLAIHRQDFGTAESIARRHEGHPIRRWRERFGGVAELLRQRSRLTQVEQLVTSEDSPPAIPADAADLAVWDRDRRQERAADAEPEVIVRVEGDRLRVEHRRTRQATLQLYGVDLELLFSKSPFVRDGLDRMAMVRPMSRQALDFTDANGVAEIPLSADLRRQTLLVEVIAGGARSTALYYGGEISTYLSQAYGQLQCTERDSGRPVSTAYVKVFARYDDGSVRFYKDGYTDPRGRFDYASISAGDAQGASRFAILVLDEERGATLHDVAAPNR